MGVIVTISGDKQVISKLERLGAGLLNFSAAWAVLGRALTEYYGDKPFASQGGSTGQGKWAALSPIYAKRKGKAYSGKGILEATGTVRNSFTSKIVGNTLVIGNSAKQFPYHQSTAERTKMPWRPMLTVNQDVKDIIKQVIKADIAQKIRNA